MSDQRWTGEAPEVFDSADVPSDEGVRWLPEGGVRWQPCPLSECIGAVLVDIKPYLVTASEMDADGFVRARWVQPGTCWICGHIEEEMKQ